MDQDKQWEMSERLRDQAETLREQAEAVLRGNDGSEAEEETPEQREGEQEQESVREQETEEEQEPVQEPLEVQESAEEKLPTEEPQPTGYLNERELNEEIAQVCNSKARELQMMGIERVSGEDVWDCVTSKYKRGLPPLHQLINDILSLKAHAFTNWLMIQTYKQ